MKVLRARLLAQEVEKASSQVAEERRSQVGNRRQIREDQNL